MATYFEDTTPDLIPTERAFDLGFSDAKNLQKLFNRFSETILDREIPHATYRAILQEASAREPGVVFRQYFGQGILDVDFEGARRRIDIDGDMRAYYGYVIPALEELYTYGLERPYGDQWVDYFRKDSAIYRVNIVACLCTVGGLLRAGKVTRLGRPTSKALSTRPSQTPHEKDTTTYQFGIVTGGTGTTDITYTVT